MRILKAEKPHYAVLLDDSHDSPVVDCGDGDASIQIGNVILWFETRGDRERDSRVQAFRLFHVAQTIANEVSVEKSDDAYREKAIQAQAIIDGEAYDPAVHDFIEIEVRHTNKSPMAVAQSIVRAAQDAQDAAREALLEIEEKRIEKRENRKRWAARLPARAGNPRGPDRS